jgi:hypothetical protein
MRTKQYGTKAERQKAYRARKRNGNGDSNVTPVTKSVTIESTVDKDLPWPVNQGKPPRWGPGVPVYIPPTEVEKAAMARLPARVEPETGERAERARRYAEYFNLKLA